MTPRQILEGLSSNEFVEVEVGGHPFRIRTNLRVEDAIAFNAAASAMSVQGQSMVLFQLLAYMPNGVKAFPEDEDHSWFVNVDMAGIFKAMVDSGALQKVLKQLRGTGDDEGDSASDDAGGKSD